MIFFSCCFTRAEQYYSLLELEVIYLVWVYKRLYTLLYSNNKRIIMFIDHDSTSGIMKNINFNIISIDRANCRLTNVSVYLSVYPLNIYYISGRFNLVLNAFSRFRTVGDNVVRIDNEAEPTFDTIWDKDKREEPNNVFLICETRSIVRIDNFFLIKSVARINDFFQ